MNNKNLLGLLSLTAVVLACALDAHAQGSNLFTVQIGAGSTPPATLVNHTNAWFYRRGTNELPATWKTDTDASLDATWTTGPGGFGYGDPAIVGESTTLAGMINVHSTLYIRKTFTVGSIADTNLHLRLTVDYDDGFVAYLDGVEVARRNLTNGVGTFVAYDNNTVASHEASCCDSPNPAETIDLGSVSNRLTAGDHVLALIGVNGTLGSSDFHLIANLQLDGGASTVMNGTFFSLVTTNVVQLSGSNTMAGAARVVVNGDDATFNSSAGTWAKTQSLSPGMNRLFIAALDANGNILASTNRDIIAQMSSTDVGGTLAGNTSWTSAMGVIHVTNDVVAPSGVTLSVGSGVVVLLGSGVSIRATAGGTIDIAGTEANPDLFLPANGTTAWGALNATGAGASITARHLETAAGAITFNTSANGLVEDAWLHDRGSILTANSAGFITTRRLHVQNYSETIYNSGTTVLAEDSLYEGQTVASSDALEIQGGPPGSVIRRCTFRRSTGGNSDAVDFNGTSGAQIESCLIHDITDKGISLGASGTGGSPDFNIFITNCLIYRVDTGIAVKDSSTVGLFDTTISGSPFGMKLYQKFTTPVGGGLVTNGFNNLIWGNTVSLDLTNDAVVTINYSDVQGTNWPGTGNISADPLFVNAAADNYNLGAGSPAIGTGLGGANMGAHWPVGGLPSKPVNLAANAAGSNPPLLWWQEDADNEDGFSIERSTDAANWQIIGAAGANVTNHIDASALAGQLYYYRVRATNVSGASRFSNIASARSQGTTTFVGGTLTGNTVWSPALGPIYVVSNVTVPTNITLTIEAGTIVRLTNNAMLTASTGGVIRIMGTWDARVVLERWNGINNWAEIRAEGTNSYLEMHFADISGGQTTVYYGATALLEDTFFHDFRQQGATTIFNQPLILTHWAGPCFVRRCHLDNYHETLWRHGLNTIEDTVFEHTSGDALDFDTGLPGSVIRRCTFRHGNLGNVDAIDMGNDGAVGTLGAIIEDCHMFDFPFDKGVSIGENSFNITVRNCLIHHVVRGVQVKDVCTANIYNCTITEAAIGIHGYEKVAGTGAGKVTNSYNNILWGLSSNSIIYDPAKSEMVVNYTDTQGSNWPGSGNISSDPLFVNPAAGDWRLQPGSPCIGTGKDGSNMGVTLPVGVFVTAPSQLTAMANPSSVLLSWRDNSPSEAVFLIERAMDGGSFTNLAFVPLNITNYTDTAVLTGHAYRYRVRGANISTNSEYSNEVLADAGLAVVITAPAEGDLLRCPTNLTITAMATSGTGSVAQVEFFAGAASLGVVTNSPYNIVWSNVPLGAFALTAVATENSGRLATSAPVNITAITNVPPGVSLTAPANGATFTAPGPITLSADASDADGNLAKVEFFQGTNKLGEATNIPFSFVWNDVPAGAYALTAVASDSVGLRATSAPVNITVQAPVQPWGALQLNGSSQYVTFGSAPTLGVSNFTLEAWVIWTGGGATASSGSGGITAIPVITKGRGEGDGTNRDCNYYFGILANGRLAADFEEYPTTGAGGTNQPITGMTPVTTNTWHHVAATYDGTYWSLYLDGRMDTNRFVGKPPRWDSLQHAGLGTAMTSAGTAAGYFAGIIDEARIWNYARSAAQISNNMSLPILSAPGLLGRWSLDEISGVLSYDTSGNNIYGTNINSPVHAWGYPFAAPPVVAITSPLDGANFYTPGNLTISATATALVSTITGVAFLAGTNDLGVITSSPYNTIWSNPPAGHYVLTAIATDLANRKATSAPVNLTVIQNLAPVVTLTSPTGDLTIATSESLPLAATASDADGAVTNLAFYANTTSLGQFTNEPFTLNWTNIAEGNYAVTAVATDDAGVSTTSGVVHVTVSSATNLPAVAVISPSPSSLESLTQITITFSKTVLGVNASDLLINGTPAGGMSGAGSNYTFLFVQPAFGTVSISWATNHGITDVFTPAHAFDENGAGATWQYQLGDFTPPVVTALAPTPGAILPAFTSASVSFSENVLGVDGADLLVNGTPATNVTGSGAGPFVFTFAQPASGGVLLSWAAGHGIHDSASNPFTGSPWSYTLDTNVAGVVISEIMYHPSSESTAEEWIELYNAGATNVNLTGWRLSQGVRFTFPNVTVPAGDYLVVAANVAVFTSLHPGITNVVGGWEGILSNNRNTLHLDDAMGRRADTVPYAAEGDWAIRQREVDLGFQGWKWLKEHDGHDKTLELISPAMPNQYGQNWGTSLVTNGTPGQPNSAAAANIPPLILDVQHLPLIPANTNPVIVSARILDERASNVTVTLHWRVDAATPPAFTSTNMFDDGTHGDGVAGDGLFAATLPPQPHSAIVEFYVRAQDQDGLVRTWPAPALDTNGVSLGQAANMLYQVDTSAYTGSQPIYRLIMTEREWAVLYAIQHGSYTTWPAAPGTSQSDATMNGTFISLDGTGSDCRYTVGIRNRGHGTRVNYPNNFRVDFNSDNLWKNVAVLNLNGQYTHMQVFGAALAQRSGLAGADSRAVQVRVNSTNLALLDNYPTRTYGSYAANEMLNSDWAEHHFPTDSSGNIYRAVRDIYVPSANFEWRGTNANQYTNCFLKNSNQSEDDWTDLANMLRVMGTNDLFTTANVRQVINVEQWLLHLAVMALFDNRETGLNMGFNDDYFMYRGVNDSRFILVFYDMDSVLGRSSSTNNRSIFNCATTNLSPPQDSGVAMGRFVNWPDFLPIYYRTLQRLIDTTFSAAQFNDLLNETLGSYVPGANLQTITNWMNGRRAYVQSVIAPYVTPASNTPLATLSGEPRAVTPLTSATLIVGGADVIAYRFKLNDGDYGDEASLGIPITLSALPHGSTNTVRVIGKTAAGVWQSTNSPTVSRTWVVLTNWPSVRLNEILARNDTAVNWYGQHPDLIELFNEGATTADLSGLRLTDDSGSPNKFTFPAGTTLAAGEYLVVLAGNIDGTPGLHTGFALNQDGEGVYLYDHATNGDVVLDSVAFGLQIADFSIGRLGSDASWLLTQPTFGSANLAQTLGSPLTLKLNEWLALGQPPFADDFIELFNPAALPVALGGLYLSEEPFGTPAMHAIAPLSFIASLGHQNFLADGQTQNGANHLNFQLDAEQGLIGLMAADLSPIDEIWYGPQTMNLATGRCPDGSDKITALVFPTPGAANACPPEPPAPLTLTLLASTNFWSYEQSGTNLGTAWRATNYDDSAWPQGPGVLGYEIDALPEAINTLLTVGSSKTNFYFRTTFVVPDDTNLSALQLTHLIDDGAVFYLNGEEAYRYNMPAGTILATTFSSTSIDASSVGPVSLPLTNLHVGTNFLAAEVHQSTASSSDIVFGCRLALLVLTNTPVLSGLVLNEILANNGTLKEMDGSTPDWIELHNPSDTGVDLSDMSLTDSAANARRWIFPAGAVIDPHGYYVIRCDSGLPASANNTGFGLKADGDSVYLFDKLANGGGVIDYVGFGLQTPDLPIGRLPGASSTWGLTLPTPGATNLVVAMGDPMQLKFNEWMANPSSGDDWFEIYNPQALPVALGGLWLTDKLTTWNNYQIPALSFIGTATNGFQRFWADNKSGGEHANFALKNSGEQLGLYTATALLIDGLSFGDQSSGVSEGRLPDGAANRVFFTDPTPGNMNFLPLTGVVINEVLAHTDPPLEDAIELHNLTAAPVDISGWWLSDGNDRPKKYQIPAGTILPPGGFAVFYEYHFNDDNYANLPFALSSANGDEVYLSAADAGGALTGYRTSVKFGASFNGVSFGRYVTSTGDADFPSMPHRTLGTDNPADLTEFRTGSGLTNPYPLVGPVVISEIMYHPPDIGTNDNVIDEFIELRNITAQTVFLYDTNYHTNTWHLRDAVDFAFPTNVSLAPGEWIVVVSFDPATNAAALAQFQARYGTNATLFGPWTGKLDNSTDSVELKRPDNPDFTPGPDYGSVPSVLVDRVHYHDTAPWPIGADGYGHSLHRFSLSSYGNDPVNWGAFPPTPGAGGPQGSITGQIELPGFIGTSRVVVFTATDFSGHILATWTQTLAFADGVADYALTDAPPSTAHLSARPTGFLRQRLDVTFLVTLATANFTLASAPPAGDLNNNGLVDMDDYALLAAAWYTFNPAADLDGSGLVDILDYFLLAQSWLQQSDPE